MNDLRAPVITLAALLALTALAGMTSISLSRSPQPVAAAPSNPIPPLTPEMQQVLATSHGFQALVSYTDRGFEPASASIKKGDTIRFTNNSSQDLWISAAGTAAGKVYPGTGNDCGASAFDSCLVLKPHEFWEFTFTLAGTWSYRNNLNPNDTGVVKVK